MGTVLKLAGMSWRELIHTTWRDARKSKIANRAAELAFWFLLGFFPMLMSVTGMVSMLSSAPDSLAILMRYIGEVLPSAASNLVRQVLASTTGSGCIRRWLIWRRRNSRRANFRYRAPGRCCLQGTQDQRVLP